MTSESTSTITINDVDDYESLQDLFDFLGKLRFRTSEKSADNLEAAHGSDYKRCYNCDYPKCECCCDDYPYYDDYDFERDNDSEDTSLEEGNRGGHESVQDVEGNVGSDVSENG